jgi:hypothetical protein
MDRDIAGFRMRLQTLGDAPAIDIRQDDIQDNRGSLELLRQANPFSTAGSHQRFETVTAGHFSQDLRKSGASSMIKRTSSCDPTVPRSSPVAAW